MKISVIIPAFNTEKYISECINSLLMNKIENLEVIAINDGSTDNTGLILDAFDDLRVKVIHTENKGQSSARNTGVAASTGDYVIFLDSDDKLADNALDRLSEIIKDTNADVVFFESDVFFEDDALAEKFNPKYERKAELCNKTYSGIELFKKAINHDNYIVSPCLYISRKSASNGFEFKNGVIHEDNIYTTRLLLENEITAHCVKESFYLRRVRYGSVMTQVKGENHINGYYNCLIDLISNPPKNAIQADSEYKKFICHMVDCFKYTNGDIIESLECESTKAASEIDNISIKLNKEISDLKNSTSWKITSPLRKIIRLIRW